MLIYRETEPISAAPMTAETAAAEAAKLAPAEVMPRLVHLLGLAR